MKIAARIHRMLPAAVATLLAGCVYAPVLQHSYPFERHPGVTLEVWWQYGYEGTTATRLVNRGTVDKCAWTDRLDSHLLRVGESWQVGAVQSPGNVVVTNVMPWDPNCAKAKSELGAPRR